MLFMAGSRLQLQQECPCWVMLEQWVTLLCDNSRGHLLSVKDENVDSYLLVEADPGSCLHAAGEAHSTRWLGHAANA